MAMITTYLNPPMHYTIAEFRAMLENLALGSWRPRFPTLHNTGVPSLAQWLAYGPTPQEQWGANLNRYYAGLGWHAGPHLVVCPAYVWVLCDLTKPGVSVSCWNDVTFGIEMVGNYEIGGDDFSTGVGANVRDNAVAVLDVLYSRFGWGDPADFVLGQKGLHFHHDCVKDHHPCPGSKVTKADVVSRMKSSGVFIADTVSVSINVATTPAPPTKTLPAILSVDDIQAALNAIGILPALKVDGKYGEDTKRNVEVFQTTHNLTPVDGWVGPDTTAAIIAALRN